MSALVTVLAFVAVLALVWAIPAALAWALIHGAALIERRENNQ